MFNLLKNWSHEQMLLNCLKSSIESKSPISTWHRRMVLNFKSLLSLDQYMTLRLPFAHRLMPWMWLSTTIPREGNGPKSGQSQSFDVSTVTRCLSVSVHANKVVDPI